MRKVTGVFGGKREAAMNILMILKKTIITKVLVVVVMAGGSSIKAAHGLGGEIDSVALHGGDVLETPEQTQERLRLEKLEKQAQRRAFLAEQRAKSSGNKNVGFKDPEEKPSLISTPALSSGEVVGEKEPVVSASQEEAIINVGKSSGFSPVGEEDHSLSSVESLEREVQNNQKSQQEIEGALEKIEKEGISEQNNEHYEKLKARYRSLQEQENVLKNAQDFLSFCKESSSPVTFTAPELEKIFTVLNVPSLLEEDVKTMAPYELGNLKADVGSGIKFVQDAPFTEEKKNILVEYLKDRGKEISKQLKERDSLVADIDADKIRIDKFVVEEHTHTIKMRMQALQDLLNTPGVSNSEILAQRESLRVILSRYKHTVSEKTISDKALKAYQQFTQAYNEADAFLENFSTFSNVEVTADNLKGVVNTLLTSAETGVGLQKFISARILKNLQTSDLSIEQKQFVKKIIQQTETFAHLKAQATQAVTTADVVRMQELQDEMRDFYEDVMRNTWKDEGLTKIDGEFLGRIRNSLNELLPQFSAKASSFEGVVKNKKSVVAQVKYQFKRLLSRVKRIPKVRYVSESAANKENFGLHVVDFKKAATEGYVKTVKEAVDSYKKTLTNVHQVEKDSLPLMQSDAKKREQASLKIPAAIKNLETHLDSAKVIRKQVEALKGIADCNGILTYKRVEQSLSLGSLPTTGEAFIKGLDVQGDGQSTRYKEAAFLLLEKDGSVTAQESKDALENQKALTKDQQTFLSKLYTSWRKGIEGTLKTGQEVTDVQLLTLLQRPSLTSEYLAMVRSPETGPYVLDVYTNKKDGVVPSAQAKTVVKQLQESKKEIDNFITTATKTLRRWK
jgi:hypothetical protein